MLKIKLKDIFFRYLASPEKYARYLGVTIGNNCFISTRKWSSEPYLITIGNNVQITDDVRFFTHGGSHVLRERYPNFDVFGKIVIEDGVYIGSCSLIMPGVTIGKGALVAAGSVVTKSVPPNVVVAGNPARVVSTKDEFMDRILRFNIDSKSLSKEDKRALLLSIDSSKFIKK